MRTTLNIADDVLYAVRERARREGRSMGEVLSEVARKGLMGEQGPGEVVGPQGLHGFEPLPKRGEAVSREFVDRLLAEDAE